jgi:hypothetical protein
MLILTPEKECKIGQNNPENRRTLSFATTSFDQPGAKIPDPDHPTTLLSSG